MKARFLLLLIALGLGLAGCSWATSEENIPRQKVKLSCAEPRLSSSFQFQTRSKEYLTSYYKTRKESELFFAWYASEDSDYMAKSIQGCWDKKNKHYHAVRNMIRKNSILQKVITQNMRQDNHSQLSELFLDDYRKIFVRDIQ